MSELHYDEETFLAYLDDRSAVNAPDDLQEHLGHCTSCHRLFDSVQEFFSCLGDAEVWGEADPALESAEPDPAMIEEFLAHARRIGREEAVAEEMVPALLATPAETWRAEMHLTPELRSLPALRVMSVEARKVLETSPERALRITTLAAEFAEVLPLDSYSGDSVFHLRGACWKEQANALRYLGRFKEALKALDRAEICFSHASASQFNLATVAYVRATVLCEIQRTEEALSLARSSADIFLAHGDVQRYAHARILEGGVHVEQRQYATARDTFMALIKPLRAAGDLPTLARVYSAIGHTLIQIGDTEAAGTYFLQAMLMFQESGNAIGKIKSRWGLGRLLVSSGKLEEGVVRLRETRAEFEAMMMRHDAGLVSLDLAEALLAMEEREEIPAICGALVEQFSSEGMNSNAMKALAYLREAVDDQSVTADIVRHVREYLEDLPRQPARAFVPPPLPS
jgi:tetratricopeptide (TPR) repeat protein